MSTEPVVPEYVADTQPTRPMARASAVAVRARYRAQGARVRVRVATDPASGWYNVLVRVLRPPRPAPPKTITHPYILRAYYRNSAVAVVEGSMRNGIREARELALTLLVDDRAIAAIGIERVVEEQYQPVEKVALPSRSGVTGLDTRAPIGPGTNLPLGVMRTNMVKGAARTSRRPIDKGST